MIDVVPLSLFKPFVLLPVPVNATFAGERLELTAQRNDQRSRRNLSIVSYGRAAAKVRGRWEQHYLRDSGGPRPIHLSFERGTRVRAQSPRIPSYWPRQA